MENKKVSLAQGTDVELRGLTVSVYAPTFDKLVDLQDKMTKFDKIKDLSKQMEAAVEVLYDLLKPHNDTITKDKIKTTFSLVAFTEIIRIAFGSVQQ